MPPAVKRLLWWMALPLMVVIGGAVAYQLPIVQSSLATQNHWVGLTIPILCFVPLFISIFGIWYGQSRIQRAVASSNGRACLHCVHDLSGMGTSGKCPECGKTFELDQTLRGWNRVKMYKL